MYADSAGAAAEYIGIRLALTQTVILSGNHPVRRTAQYTVLHQHHGFPRDGRRVFVFAVRYPVQCQIITVGRDHRVPLHRVPFLFDVIVLRKKTRYVRIKNSHTLYSYVSTTPEYIGHRRIEFIGLNVCIRV